MDIIEAEALTVQEAAVRMAAMRGRRTTANQIDVWIREGYRPRNWPGDRLRLRCVMVGGRRLIMPAWLDEFQRGRLAMVPCITKAPKGRQRDHERAMERLRKLGVA